jgi:glycerol-3-phosphate dehydrogenase
MVCRCEQVTKREILDALSDPLGARTLMSIKYRTRATMGRCQGGFCFPKIVNIMTRELGYDPEEISLRDEKSFFFPGRVRKEEVAL